MLSRDCWGLVGSRSEWTTMSPKGTSGSAWTSLHSMRAHAGKSLSFCQSIRHLACCLVQRSSQSWMPTWGFGRSHYHKTAPTTPPLLPPLGATSSIVFLLGLRQHLSIFSFLGMVNQLGKFVPNLAEKDKALRSAVKEESVVLGP